MNARREAILSGAKWYSGRCSKNPAHRHRWTGSGACTDCHPRRRGTLITAMTALYGPARISLEYAQQIGLPLFRAVCTAQGHSSWRYVKTPHICLQCVAIARARSAAATPRKVKPAKAAPAGKWYFVVDLCSGLVVSPVYTSGTAASLVRREIKRDHPSMLPMLSVRKQSIRARAEIEAMSALRLDRHPKTPTWPVIRKTL